MDAALLAHLNAAQREAVLADSGPVLVLAGAGTGKTRVVTYRIARLIACGTQPERILAVTFTNKAAQEMRGRVTELLGRRLPTRPEVSTFHSLCVRILRRHAERLGYPSRFVIYDRSEQEGIARQVLRELQLAEAKLRPDELVGQISAWKSRGIRPAQAIRMATLHKEHLAASGYRRYQSCLKQAAAVDFDDLLLLTEDLFSQHADVLDAERRRFDHILIDEYQDTNACQYRIVRALACEHRNLCVVGDDDQSIYGWRGAEVRHILSFQHDWPDARVIKLEENYRSTGAILRMANRLIVHNRMRHPKELKAATSGGKSPRILQFQDDADEARQVVLDIAAQIRGGREPREIAILFRTNEQPRPFESELRRMKIPYVLIGSTSFYDRREVKDILAYLRVLDSPEDELALRRIINVPRRGIGEASLQALLAHAHQSGQSLWQTICQAPSAAGKGQAHVERFARLLEKYRRQLRGGSLAETARALVMEIGYQGELERMYDDPNEQQARWGAVEQLVNGLAEFEQQQSGARLREFLDRMALDDRAFDQSKEKKLQRNALVLLTLHSAKGLEFPCVYIVGMEEGILPHRRSGGDDVDEERRLCYVGVTRAREQLTLSLAQKRRKWGKLRPSIPSRFLFELTGQAERAPRGRTR